ncbi:deaminase [Actinomadura rayongensis]|uniref:dCMP deaminase n=1 Tax=Actinomadura rayongensis TaxID=1429076 RepID=A0A6I4W9D1_9ACTN|nr:dCMP deaminase [Actinomadura rayongensis]
MAEPQAPGSTDADLVWLDLACDLAALCPPSESAFSVGAVIVAADGTRIARGHSREDDPKDHAEESALRRVPAGTDLGGATLYSSLEPCGRRASRPRPCADLILAAGIRRVVFAWSEPDVFVPATGADRLRAAGVEVVEMPALAARAKEPNAHLLG